MTRPKNLTVVCLALLLAACVSAWYLTRNAGFQIAATPSKTASQASLIDDSLLRTARQAAALAETPDEQEQARTAERLADHELDQAFATALREAQAPAPKNSAPAQGPLQQLTARIAELKARVAAGKTRIAQLTKDAAAHDTAGDELDLAKAQLELDQDELDDAAGDLAREGGDRHSKIEQALQQHEAADHDNTVPSKPAAAGSLATLWAQAGAWLALGSRDRDLLAAQRQASAKASELVREHNALEPKTQGATAAAPASAEGADTAAIVERLRHLSDQKKTLTELDKRVQDCQQLAAVYRRWSGVVEARRGGVLHVTLLSLAWILAILLAVVLADRAIRHAFRQKDRRRLHQLRAIGTIATQLAGAIAILLIVFGPPTQLSTIIGLATAGLTVVLKDFIVAFFGWFVLMGKNGIHLGDWVEIEGIGGEVIEIGILNTVLLEMGNWTNTGHPTGRRVSFVNSFAMERHYFNFSTEGQWFWDELQVTLPVAGDPYGVAQQIHEVVERETAEDARQAELDWERVTHKYGIRPFSAKPAVDLRPGINGLEVVVRYITRAPRRYEVKSRLFQAVVDLLHKPAIAEAGPGAA